MIINIKKIASGVILPLAIAFSNSSCKKGESSSVSNISQKTVESLCSEIPEAARGIRNAASLWRDEDGSQEEFCTFVRENVASDSTSKRELFQKLSDAFEKLNGAYNQLTIDLQKPTVLAGPEPSGIDYIMSGYSPSAHLQEDLFANKVAFITMLNFPKWSLEEKNTLGKEWSRLEWAYARMGDLFTTRIPAEVLQREAKQTSSEENYIANYNIMMGHLITEKGERLFPAEMSLLSHWNLRDELKSNYAEIPNANRKQEMIYQVMLRIADQSIPEAVVNNPEYDWEPYSNKAYKDNAEVHLKAEETGRYQKILERFHINQELDRYNPSEPTGIIRNFEGGMEISAEEIESLFINLISSKEVVEVAKLIEKRLGRALRPYDIWYDGFKSRSTMPEERLTKITKERYPSTEAFAADIPRMLQSLGFSADYSRCIADKIEVEGARGSGHAWPSAGRGYKNYLRTRLVAGGMDYKAYNIAVHEFGHNTEGTIDLYDIDYYMMAGIPNTAFTEALAFIFQKRDLQMLGIRQSQSKERNTGTTIDKMTTLDIFWGMYEIMGVSLVDMYTWRWLYENPNATAAELKENCLRIAREVWNKYYAPLLGEENSHILAIYSHMVNAPMYLPNYPFGHIIEYQLEEHFSKLPDPAAIGPEIERIYKGGRLTPQLWMQRAIGKRVSTEPIIAAVREILSTGGEN